MFNTLKDEDIHKGDIIWEDSQYGSIQIEVLTEPELNGDEFTFKGRTAHGEINFLANTKARHYGPRFARSPNYLPATYLEEQSNG